MSKSTNRYGKITMQARITIDADRQPSARLVHEWKELDEQAQKEFGKPYDALTEKQKSALHFKRNTGAFDEPTDERD